MAYGVCVDRGMTPVNRRRSLRPFYASGIYAQPTALRNRYKVAKLVPGGKRRLLVAEAAAEVATPVRARARASVRG